MGWGQVTARADPSSDEPENREVLLLATQLPALELVHLPEVGESRLAGDKARGTRWQWTALGAAAEPGGAPDPARVEGEGSCMIKKVHHVVLFYSDVEAARQWFETTGFTYARGYGGMHWFELGDAEVMLHPAETPSGGSGLTIHVAVDDVRSSFAKVVAAGLAPFDHQVPGDVLLGPVTRPWGDREFELQDPGGHLWAFTQA